MAKSLPKIVKAKPLLDFRPWISISVQLIYEPEIQKMLTLKEKGDQKTEKVPMGTNVATVPFPFMANMILVEDGINNLWHL